ncbi:hypothetical protein O9H85_28225 [Paenibacillus filicis]|uniref:Uncharacterized protein n=1 Tax=Paenibacillus gyeongsangnamensis TaxID=3388067 RepID=A0ABT4QH77_9BACL|nr:hypothetical protein [Paenibacillus filicis]MCZ8516212.1 hypothetical protein [Paenibacillus filicis]
MNKRHWPWILLTAGLSLCGGSWITSVPQAAGGITMNDSVSAAGAASAKTAAVHHAGPVPAAAVPKAPSMRFERVNGVSVSDDLKTLYEIKGEPLRVESDPLLKHERIFVYKDCRIGLYDNFIQYVSVPGDNALIEIDGQIYDMNPDVLKKVLGKPSFIAEDGLVYRKGQVALKLFLDPSGKLNSVHLFSAMAD